MSEYKSFYVPSIVLRKFNSGYNRLATSDLDGRLASRLSIKRPAGAKAAGAAYLYSRSVFVS